MFRKSSCFICFILCLSLVGTTISCRKKETQKVSIGFGHVGKLQRVFNDMHDKHIVAAEANGSGPFTSRDEAESHGDFDELETCKYYELDPLKHSVPLLVPKARKLLETIGENFSDSLKSRGAGSYRPIVTSVLRVEEDVTKLRKRNSNASSNSAHRYGTTFDIAYNRFGRSNEDYEVGDLELKSLLSEVLRDLQKEGKCYVKYEVKQGCFHITVR